MSNGTAGDVCIVCMCENSIDILVFGWKRMTRAREGRVKWTLMPDQ